MPIVLVTGGTGSLGHHVVERLLKRDYQVRLLSRRESADAPSSVRVMVGDLVAGTGLEAATSGVDAVIHCASDFADPERTDVVGTRLLLGAARTGGTPHVLYISIVGVDRTAFPYYQAKRAAELLVEHAELPWTILRTTQFHGLVAHLLQSWGADALPEIPVPTGLRFQSIDVGEVADRLVALFERGPSGHVPDLGGPQILSIEEMAQSYLRHRCRQATIHAVEPASKMLTMMRTGIILTPEHAEGKVTWEQYLQRNG